MGCGSSLPKNTGPVGISPQLKKLLVGGGEDAEGSPPSSIDLASEEYRNATAVDGQLWGELIRAGYVHLYYNHDTCNKINVFPIPDGDTGTNMIITLRNAITALGSSPEKDIKHNSKNFVVNMCEASKVPVLSKPNIFLLIYSNIKWFNVFFI